jgi:uncharacterized surface protein with fasciclin (FAS1) repeats
MIIRLFIALLFAVGMLGAGVAQETPPSPPTEPTQPTDPAQPTEPTEPTQPTQPTEPTQPDQPAQPTDPAPAPAQPEQPAQAPTDPVEGAPDDTADEFADDMDADIVVPGGIPEVVLPIEDLLSTLWRNPGLIEFHSALMAAQVDAMVPQNEMFTIFAPTDAAVLDASDVMLTRDSLAFHVVRGAYSYAYLWRMADAAGGSTTLTTLQGDDLTIEISGNTLRIEGQASITQANLPADNGFVHVISSVIQPTARIDLGG